MTEVDAEMTLVFRIGFRFCFEGEEYEIITALTIAFQIVL
jgi:hypothetical protein